MQFNEPDKLLFPAVKFSRGNVIEYYLKAAPYLLPHFRDRPCAVKRFPHGIHGEAFWEKDLPGYAPDWLPHTFVPRKDPSQPPIRYVDVDNPEVLAWLGNHDTIELHPFLHRSADLATPNFVAFDLDPGEAGDTGTLRAIAVALLIRDFIEDLGLKAWPKVSGSKGIQLYVPLNVPVTYAGTQAFARTMAELLERKHPHLVVAKMARALRAGKVFIDWSQNMPHKTTVGPYSMRAKHHRPTISMPIEWDELRDAHRKKATEQLKWSPAAALARMEKVGDLWAPVLRLKQRLPAEFMGLAEPTRPRATSRNKPLRAVRSMPRRSAQGSRRRFIVHRDAGGGLHLRLEIGDTIHSWTVRSLPLAKGRGQKIVEEPARPVNLAVFADRKPTDSDASAIWDRGTFDIVRGDYDSGNLAVFLNGAKLAGELTLARTAGGWRLLKSGAPATADVDQQPPPSERRALARPRHNKTRRHQPANVPTRR